MSKVTPALFELKNRIKDKLAKIFPMEKIMQCVQEQLEQQGAIKA